MKKVFYFILTVVLAALVSCQKTGPAEPVWVEIPYSVSTDITKVTYNNGYSQKTGDKLRVKGTVREDISGLLEYNNGQWEGNLRYLQSEGEPAAGTALTVTLVHADNADEATYGHGCLSVSTLAEAAEKLSLLTGSTTFGSTATVTLTQQATFVQVTVSFDFIGTGTMVTGETSVDVIVGGLKIASGTAEIVNVAAPGDPAEYQAHFFMALPGGTAITENDYVEICDRKAYLRNSGTSSVTLAANTKYTLNRTIEYKPELGDPYWSDGTYGRIAHPAGVSVVGIIVFVNNYASNDNSELAVQARAITEDGYGFGHALVMSLKNAATAVKWGSGTYTSSYVTTPSATLNVDNISGFHNTSLQSGCTAADYALNYRSGDTHTGTDSGWFLPSIGQWMYSISRRGFGGADPAEDWIVTNGNYWLVNGSIGNLVGVKQGETNENLLVISLNNRLEVLREDFGSDYDSFGMSQGTKYGDNYWTSSEYSSSEALRMNLGSVETIQGHFYSTIKVNKLGKGKTDPGGDYAFSIMKVRPFLAF